MIWLGKSGKVAATVTKAPEKRPQDWCEAEKLKAIIKTSTLDAENLNSYCRQNDIYRYAKNEEVT